MYLVFENFGLRFFLSFLDFIVSFLGMRLYFTLPDPFPYIFSSFILILSSAVLTVNSSFQKSSSILSISSRPALLLFHFSIVFPFFIPFVLSSPSHTYQGNKIEENAFFHLRNSYTAS